MPARVGTLSGSATVASIFLQVGARHRTADAFQIGGDLAADIAAIEIVEPGMGEMLERVGERGLLQAAPDFGRLAVDEKGLQKARRGFELGVFFDASAAPGCASPRSPRAHA